MQLMLFYALAASNAFINYTTGPQTYDSGTSAVFLDCFFYHIVANANAAGIFVQGPEIIVEISRCGFYMCSCTQYPSGGAVFLLTFYSYKITKVCFEFCSSSHGQSYGIYGDSVSELKFDQMNLTCETKVGFESVPSHPSFIGGYNKLTFSHNNNSECKVSSVSCGFYFYGAKDTTYTLFNQISNGFGFSTIILNGGSIPILKNHNIINNTISSYLLNINQYSVTIDGFVFQDNSDVNLAGASHFPFQNAVFSNCAFDIQLSKLKTPYCTFTGVNIWEDKTRMNQINKFHINECHMMGEYSYQLFTTSQKQVQSLVLLFISLMN